MQRRIIRYIEKERERVSWNRDKNSGRRRTWDGKNKLDLDGGMEPARKYVKSFLLTDIEHKSLFYDAKTTLQEMVQKDGKGVVTYELVSESGPDHNIIA